MWHSGVGRSKLGDSHYSILGTLEDSSVGCTLFSDKFHESRCANWMSSLYTTNRHSIRYCVKREVHVLLEKSVKLLADKERLRLRFFNNLFPDHLLLAISALSLVLWSIKVVELGEIGAWLILTVRWCEVILGWYSSITVR